MFYLYSGTTSSMFFFMVPAPSGGSPTRRQRQGLREKVKKSLLRDVVTPPSVYQSLDLLATSVGC